MHRFILGKVNLILKELRILLKRMYDISAGYYAIQFPPRKFPYNFFWQQSKDFLPNFSKTLKYSLLRVKTSLGRGILIFLLYSSFFDIFELNPIFVVDFFFFTTRAAVFVHYMYISPHFPPRKSQCKKNRTKAGYFSTVF